MNIERHTVMGTEVDVLFTVMSVLTSVDIMKLKYKLNAQVERSNIDKSLFFLLCKVSE